MGYTFQTTSYLPIECSVLFTYITSIFSLVLIIVSRDDNASDGYLRRLLDLVFHAMVMVYGLDDIINIKNVERFKREIKVSLMTSNYEWQNWTTLKYFDKIKIWIASMIFHIYLVSFDHNIKFWYRCSITCIEITVFQGEICVFWNLKVWKLSYPGSTWSVSWLLMPWLIASTPIILTMKNR